MGLGGMGKGESAGTRAAGPALLARCFWVPDSDCQRSKPAKTGGGPGGSGGSLKLAAFHGGGALLVIAPIVVGLESVGGRSIADELAAVLSRCRASAAS